LWGFRFLDRKKTDDDQKLKAARSLQQVRE
jgi:hypothetical protein